MCVCVCVCVCVCARARARVHVCACACVGKSFSFPLTHHGRAWKGPYVLRPSLRSLPKSAFSTVPLTWINTDRSRPPLADVDRFVSLLVFLRTGWKTRPRPKTVILPIKKSIKSINPSRERCFDALGCSCKVNPCSLSAARPAAALFV